MVGKPVASLWELAPHSLFDVVGDVVAERITEAPIVANGLVVMVLCVDFLRESISRTSGRVARFEETHSCDPDHTSTLR